jgi:Nucleotidyl transferase AbiEii toxin, Type IV TA system
MTFKYATPGAMEKAIRSKAREVARETGRAVGDLVLEFYFQRLLARIFQNDGWMLKGGQALLVRFPQQARASRDADLFRPGVDDINEALEELRGAAALDLNDYFRFVVKSHELARNGAGNGAKVKIEVLIGLQSKMTLNVDLVVKRTPIGEPTIMRLESMLDMVWPDTWPDVVLYPLADHVADKVCAMYELHERLSGADVPSTRFRDLGDLLLISQQQSLEGRAVQFALRSEVPRRRELGLKLTLPSMFEIPDPGSWAMGYPKAAAEITGLRGCRSLEDAVMAAGIFITPLLGASDPGVWDPVTARWTQR